MATRTRDVVVATVIVLGAAFAGWRALSLALADHWAKQSPASALSWRPGHPLANLHAAEQALRAKDSARAAQWASASLARDPLDGRGYRVLAQVAQARNDVAGARRLAGVAAQRAPRDVPAQLWLERDRLLAGDVAGVLRHADRILRVEPRQLPRQYPLLQGLAALPQAQPAMATALARVPPWRDLFLRTLATKAPDSAAVAPLFERVATGPHPLTDFEQAVWLDRLVADHRYAQAWLSWAASLPAARQQHLANLNDGGFERDPGLSAFDWRIQPAEGVYVERTAVEGASGDALGLYFEDRRTPFANVKQLLVLPPGRYALQGRARADGLRSAPGLVWMLSCAEDNRELARTPALRGITPWQAFDTAFEVPAQGCAGQWLVLQAPARIAAEQRIGGRAWYDAMRVTRADQAAVSTAPGG